MTYLAQQMIGILSDRKLKKESVNSDRDYSGGGWFDEKTESLFLCSDKSFAFIIESFSSVSSGGFSMPSQSRNEYFGSWDVIEENDVLYLLLLHQDGSQEKLQTRNLGAGLQQLNNQTWHRYLIE
jgi:hypothetical protein